MFILLYLTNASFYSYDKQDIFGKKNRAKFTNTVDFVEAYLRQISSNIWAFNNKEQNKLTYEVSYFIIIYIFCSSIKYTIPMFLSITL